MWNWEAKNRKGTLLGNKRKLKGKEIWIEKDQTLKGRTQWKLRRVAEEERRKGKGVWVEYGRIKIDEEWWI